MIDSRSRKKDGIKLRKPGKQRTPTLQKEKLKGRDTEYRKVWVTSMVKKVFRKGIGEMTVTILGDLGVSWDSFDKNKHKKGRKIIEYRLLDFKESIFGSSKHLTYQVLEDNVYPFFVYRITTSSTWDLPLTDPSLEPRSVNRYSMTHSLNRKTRNEKVKWWILIIIIVEVSPQQHWNSNRNSSQILSWTVYRLTHVETDEN